MTRRRDVVCDVCGDVITGSGGGRSRGLWVTFKLGLFSGIRMMRRRHGITSDIPVETGWIQSPTDICGECWSEILADVKERVVSDD